MKKIVLTAFLLTAIAGQSLAQRGPGGKEKKTPEERANRQTEMMEKKLSLTASQKAKIYTINLERVKKMEEMHKEGRPEPQKRDSLMLNIEKQIEAVLNDDQRKTYAELREKAHEQRDNRRPGPERNN